MEIKKMIKKKLSRSIWKRHHCFRQYFGPVHTFPLLFENEDFLLLFDLVCFVLFSPVWPIDDNSVSGDNSYRKCILSKCYPTWRLEYVCFSFTCSGRTKTEVFEYNEVIHHIPRELCMLRKGCIRISIFFLSFSVDGRKLWIRYLWKSSFHIFYFLFSPDHTNSRNSQTSKKIQINKQG